MIVCPNCTHQNPDGAIQCEACYTPLPALTNCHGCGALVQSDASFCGQCGADLRAIKTTPPGPQEDLTVPDLSSKIAQSSDSLEGINVPDLITPEPLAAPDPIASVEIAASTTPPPIPPINGLENAVAPTPATKVTLDLPTQEGPAGATQIQVNRAKLFHVQTNTTLELPPNLTLIHVGKPNERVPPTIDVSGFPNSEIVSRIHASIRVEGDIYYIEDVGSSNGTYINNMPLPPGNRHRLRAGDRIALGKGDKVTFIFQSA